MQLAPAAPELAIEQVPNNGYMLFERALPADLVAEMYAAFTRLLESRIGNVAANRGANRWQMHVPCAPPFSDEQVIANPPSPPGRAPEPHSTRA